MLLTIILEDEEKDYQAMFESVGDPIHESLVGNKDYVDSNIVLNLDDVPIKDNPEKTCANCTLYMSANDCQDIEYIRQKAKNAIDLFCDSAKK